MKFCCICNVNLNHFQVVLIWWVMRIKWGIFQFEDAKWMLWFSAELGPDNSNLSCSGPLFQPLRSPVIMSQALQMVLVVKNPPANAGDIRDVSLIPVLGRSLEEGMATHSSILAWRIRWTEEPGGLQFTGLQRAGHDWSDLSHAYTRTMKKKERIAVSWRAQAKILMVLQLR